VTQLAQERYIANTAVSHEGNELHTIIMLIHWSYYN